MFSEAWGVGGSSGPHSKIGSALPKAFDRRLYGWPHTVEADHEVPFHGCPLVRPGLPHQPYMGAGVQFREHGRYHGTGVQHVPEWTVPCSYPRGRYDQVPLGP